MANIFKTTLKKDVIADIANNNIREIRFPITKFWATRLTDSYDLIEKVFEFRTFDYLEVSSPSNKDTEGETYELGFVRTYVDGDEFIVEFNKDGDDCINEDLSTELENIASEEIVEVSKIHDVIEVKNDIEVIDTIDEEKENVEAEVICEDDVYESTQIHNSDVFTLLNDVFNDNMVMENFYEDSNVFATNARQVIVLTNGRVLGFNKTLPVNNDVEVRIEFDMSDRIYFDAIRNIDVFEEEVYRTLDEIKKNNFVFVWKRYTGIFMDSEGRVYFGIKYSTRKSIGFNRKYNVQ